MFLKGNKAVYEAMKRLRNDNDWLTVLLWMEGQRLTVMTANCTNEGPALYRANGAAIAFQEFLDEARTAEHKAEAILAGEARRVREGDLAQVRSP